MTQRPFILSIEGKDGAGKTTAARNVTMQLCRDGKDVTFLNKKEWRSLGEDSITGHMTDLQRLLWLHEPTHHETYFSGLHWYFMIAAWYHAYGLLVRDMENEIIVFDGLHYKYIARYLLRAELNPSVLRDVFTCAPKPDLIVHLDIDSSQAYRRKSDLSQFEAGQQDGLTGSERSSFCEYQDRVSALLKSEFPADAQVVNIDARGNETDVAKKIMCALRGAYLEWQSRA